jgi:hypothetical protein
LDIYVSMAVDLSLITVEPLGDEARWRKGRELARIGVCADALIRRYTAMTLR